MGNDAQRELGILLKARADIDQAVAELKQGFSETEKAAKKTAQVTEQELTSALESVRNRAALAFAGVTASIGFATHEALEAEEGITRARGVVQMAGQDWSKYAQRVAEAGSQLQATTRFTDDEATAAFTRLMMITGDAEKSLGALGTTADLAAGFGYDLETAAFHVSLALEGWTGRLGRLVPSLREMDDVIGKNATDAQKAEYILGELKKVTGGFAENEAKSANAQLEIMKNHLKDAAEQAGNAFLPMIIDIVKQVTEAAKSVGEFAAKNPELTRALAATALAGTGVVAILATMGITMLAAEAGYARLTALVSAQTAALITNSLAWNAVGIAMLSIPGWGWALAGVVAVGALAYAISESSTSADKARDSLKSLTDQTTQYADATNAAVGPTEDIAADLKKLSDEGWRVNEATNELWRPFKELGDTAPPALDATATSASGAKKSLEQLIELFKFESSDQYKEKIASLNQVIAESSDPAITGAAKKALQSLTDEYDKLTGKTPETKDRLKEIREEYKKSAEDLSMLDSRKDILSEMLNSGSESARAFAIEELKKINEQILQTKLTLAGIKPEGELGARPKGRGREISPEDDANRAAMHAATLRADWESKLVQQGVDDWVAAEAVKRASTWEGVQANMEAYRAQEQYFLTMTQSLQAATSTGMNLMFQTNMTGAQKWKAIMESWKQAAIMQISQVVTKYLWGEMAKRAAANTTFALQKEGLIANLASETWHVIASIGKWLALAAAKIYSFFAALGPFGIPLAAASVAAG